MFIQKFFHNQLMAITLVQIQKNLHHEDINYINDMWKVFHATH